ncbi:hypothetical protein ACWOEY_11220 [Enterococcus sulfureus]
MLNNIDDVIKKMEKSNTLMIEKLEGETKLKVFQDTVSEDALNDVIEDTGGYNYFRFETGGFEFNSDEQELKQTLLISYYSENNEDIDATTLKIVGVLHNRIFKFVNSKKYLIKKSNEDQYIDEVQLFFVRRMKLVC